MAQFFAYEDLTVSTTSVGFTAATYGSANYAFVLVEGAPVRFRMDAGTPTSTSGTLLNVGDRIELQGTEEIARVRFISKDGASATLRAQFAVS